MWSETRDSVRRAVETALTKAIEAGDLNLDGVPTVPVEAPDDPSHGDVATPVALGLARQARMAPRLIAETIVRHLELGRDIEKVEVAGPGFINFFLSHSALEKALRTILESGSDYGRSEKHRGETALVEFVSANPTGPLTLGHGRQAVIGDTVSRLLEAIGYDVTREYYFNDAGRQMRMLGESVRARYLELLGRPNEFPEDGYQGEYIREIARALVEEHGESLVDVEEVTPFTEKAVESIFAEIQATLKRLGIVFDEYYREHSLFERGLVDDLLAELERRGYLYEKDGAIWFKATALGRPQDRVFVRSTGEREVTYRVPDIAYHREKVRRGFDLIVDVFGADHIEEFPDVKAGLEALGLRTDHIVALFHQFVTILQEGEIVKMSTRRANFVTVDELIDEVGEDVVRYFFVMRNMNTHLNFDVKLAKTASNENPVYYLQYGHARIASIFRQARERGFDASALVGADLSLLIESEEVSLIKKLGAFPDLIQNAAENFEPHAVAHYLQDVATAFHLFYERHRVLDSENPAMTAARLALTRATQIVLANGLRLLGIRAPERM